MLVPYPIIAQKWSFYKTENGQTQKSICYHHHSWHIYLGSAGKVIATITFLGHISYYMWLKSEPVKGHLTLRKLIKLTVTWVWCVDMCWTGILCWAAWPGYTSPCSQGDLYMTGERERERRREREREKEREKREGERVCSEYNRTEGWLIYDWSDLLNGYLVILWL